MFFTFYSILIFYFYFLHNRCEHTHEKAKSQETRCASYSSKKMIQIIDIGPETYSHPKNLLQELSGRK